MDFSFPLAYPSMDHFQGTMAGTAPGCKISCGRCSIVEPQCWNTAFMYTAARIFVGLLKYWSYNVVDPKCTKTILNDLPKMETNMVGFQCFFTGRLIFWVYHIIYSLCSCHGMGRSFSELHSICGARGRCSTHHWPILNVFQTWFDRGRPTVLRIFSRWPWFAWVQSLSGISVRVLQAEQSLLTETI